MAVYQFISSDEIIANVHGTFRPNNSDWKGWARQWIADALDLMGIFSSFEDVSVDIYFDNYTAIVPARIKVIRAIEFEGMRLSKAFSINHQNRDRSRADEQGITYSFNKAKSAIKLNVESGCLTFYYKALPVDCNGFPIVTDDGNLKEALKWYIFSQMLLSGFVHPSGLTFDYCHKMYEKYYGRAKTTCGRVDVDGRENHMKLWTSLIRNYNAWGNVFFEPTTPTTCSNIITGTDNYKVSFNCNISGFTIILEPTVGIVSKMSSVSFYRPNGTYNYQIIADGYQTQSGAISVHDADVNKTIDLIPQ